MTWSGARDLNPGPSRSRTLRHLVQTSSKRSVSSRFLQLSEPLRPDFSNSSVGLLHEVLHDGPSKDHSGDRRASPRVNNRYKPADLACRADKARVLGPSPAGS